VKTTLFRHGRGARLCWRGEFGRCCMSTSACFRQPRLSVDGHGRDCHGADCGRLSAWGGRGWASVRIAYCAQKTDNGSPQSRGMTTLAYPSFFAYPSSADAGIHFDIKRPSQGPCALVNNKPLEMRDARSCTKAPGESHGHRLSGSLFLASRPLRHPGVKLRPTPPSIQP